MLVGAVSVMLSGQISPARALESINADVLLFLLGVFIAGQALEDSGYLSHLSYRFFRRAEAVDVGAEPVLWWAVLDLNQ
jgi:Na+/H+ antiporter NhaD/arsenite permease-like protein